MAVRHPAHLVLAALAAMALPGLAACKQDIPAAEETAARAAPAKVPAAVTFERETKALTFSYDYPSQAAALPGLAAILDAERAKALADLEKESAEAQKDATDNGYPFNPHMLGVSWKVTGDSSALLAMIAEISSFSGGAHGNTGYEALIWDKAAGRRIALDSVFTDAAAALEPMREAYCGALDVERLEKRGGDIGDTPDDMFDACPPFSDLVLVPYAGGEGGFDRIMFVAAPYVAGPYVEGAYEISIALPAATLSQIKPEYRPAFIASEQ